MKKLTTRRVLKTVSNYAIFFLTVGFAVGCCMMLFLNVLADSMGLVFDTHNIADAAKLTFGNVVLITLIFSTIDYIRRKNTVERPVKTITAAAERIGRAAVLEHLPKQEISCTDKMRFCFINDSLGNYFSDRLFSFSLVPSGRWITVFSRIPRSIARYSLIYSARSWACSANSSSVRGVSLDFLASSLMRSKSFGSIFSSVLSQGLFSHRPITNSHTFLVDSGCRNSSMLRRIASSRRGSSIRRITNSSAEHIS